MRVHPQPEIDALKGSFGELRLGEEGGVTYFIIENLVLPEGCEPRRLRGLLCPTDKDGYPSRLFLSQKISHRGKGQNWNADGVMILGTQWWAVSWKTNRPNQTLLEMVLDHLVAFRA